MTAERLEGLRREMLPLAESRTTLHWQSIIDLFAHVDALTARIAELERRQSEITEWRDIAEARAGKAEAELAAARKPPSEDEIAQAVACPIAAAGIITRQAAALKEAERNKGLAIIAERELLRSDIHDAEARALALERDLKNADEATTIYAGRALAAEAKLVAVLAAIQKDTAP